ncbi:MAG TPA: ABC-F family ATP-binding cassette domain-containing protein, partial [Humisphaera sp.]|nr:ABC-F family ATP-binding cassette domain-containing protein [Humisphaera sp.]
QNVQHEFDLAGGYAWRHKLEATLLGVGLVPECWEQNVATLSGGQRSRLALAKLLISEPDLLLLDEPTNHLDLIAIEWLEKYLLGFNGATVLISHDRYLLDRLATRIVWLTRCQLSSYPGNYSAFAQQRELQELTQQRQYEEQQADIEKQKEFIRRFGAGQRSKEAKGREKRLNRLLSSGDVIQQVTDQRKIHLSLNTDQRAGDRVLEVRELSKAYDSKKLWSALRFDIKRGERIGILGPNGSGKTTLLNVLLGREDADAGDIRWGANLAIGYYDQRLDEFDPENTVFEEVAEGRTVKDQEIRFVLGRMLFRGDDIDKPVSLLSGGERARVRIAQLLVDKPNVLVLDEPTNHLDIPSREALEGALGEFPGTVICVSHDRFFLNRVAGRLFILQPPNLIDFSGTYSDWVRRQAELAEAARPAKSSSKPAPSKQQKPPEKPREKKKDNPFLRPFGRLTIQELEHQITETEVAMADCESSFGDVEKAKDAARSRKLRDEYESLKKKLKTLEQEYFARSQD